MNKVWNVVIIGSGPAGLTAAIYAARSNLNPLVISGHAPGGQLTLTTEVDDYPGFPEGILGPELVKRFRAQAKRFDTKFIDEEVTKVNFKKKPFQIITPTQVILAKSVILATGASAKWLELPSEQRLIGRGVSSCAVCDGPFFKGKKVMVVGGGDVAVHDAKHLSKMAKTVILVHRRDKLRAKASLQKTISGKSNVKFLFSSAVEEILGQDKVVGVKIKNLETGKEQTIDLDGIFVAIGNQPNTNFLQGQLQLDDAGYIIVKDETKTSISGVFVAGDVADRRYRQAITAAGCGAKAAMDVDHFLEAS